MKFVYTIFLLFLFQQSFSHTLIIGNGKGVIQQNDMKGLQPGDTLAIRAGFYEKGGSFSNLDHITIVNYKGIVDFGATILVGNLNHVYINGSGWKEEIYGFRFRNLHADAFLLQGPCQHFGISFFEFRNLDGIAFNASRSFITYTGDSSTCALYKTTFRNLRLINSGALFVGSWDANSLFRNVVDSIAFLQVIVDSTSSDVCQVLGHSIYRMFASHWRITGPCSNGKHDAGIFQTAGNGTVCNIYRKDGFGYIWRSYNLALNGRADSYVYNCIDLSTDNYGTVDTRIEAGDTTTGNTIPFIRGASMHVLNNTSGNKRTHNYVSVLVVAGNFFPENGYILEVRNNLSFNNITIGANPMIKQNTADIITDTSNNIYSPDPIYAEILLDTIECKLNPASPAINQALSYPFINTDIDGISRPVGVAADIGAREFPNAALILTPRHTFSIPKKRVLKGLGLIIVIISMYVGYAKTRKNRPDSTYKFEGQPPEKG